MNAPYFPYDDKGYQAAESYLKDTGNFRLLDRERSVDGWTVIQLANSLKEKEVGTNDSV